MAQDDTQDPHRDAPEFDLAADQALKAATFKLLMEEHEAVMQAENETEARNPPNPDGTRGIPVSVALPAATTTFLWVGTQMVDIIKLLAAQGEAADRRSCIVQVSNYTKDLTLRTLETFGGSTTTNHVSLPGSIQPESQAAGGWYRGKGLWTGCWGLQTFQLTATKGLMVLFTVPFSGSRTKNAFGFTEFSTKKPLGLPTPSNGLWWYNHLFNDSNSCYWAGRTLYKKIDGYHIAATMNSVREATVHVDIWK